MTGQYPETTLTLNPAGEIPSVKARMPLILAQGIATGSYTTGALVSNIGNDINAGNNLCGAGSMGALMINKFKQLNPFLRLDAIIIDDAGASVASTATIIAAVTTPLVGTFSFNIGSKSLNTYSIATTIISTATTIGDDIAVLLLLL